MHFFVRPPQRPPFDVEVRFYDGWNQRQEPVNSAFVGSVRRRFLSTTLGLQLLDVDLSNQNFVLSDNVGCVSFHAFYAGTIIPGPDVFPVVNYGQPGPWVCSSTEVGWVDFDDSLSFGIRERRFFAGPFNFSMLIQGATL